MKGWLMAMMLVSGAVYAAEDITLVPVRENLEQGGFFVGRAVSATSAIFEGKPVAVGKDGLIVVGFDRKQAKENILKVCRLEVCSEKKLVVKARVYKDQKVTKVPKNTVEPNKKEQAQMAADSVAIAAAKNKAIEEADVRYGDLASAFDLPVKAPVSGVYGSTRSYNGKELGTWHKGFDLAAPVGTEVKVPADGVVRLVRLTFLAGNLVIIDHGAGIQTVYAHLKEADVKVGQKVRRGQVLGKVGTTGRSSGPHLHWGMYWQDVSIDPILWVEQETLATGTKGQDE